jgi:hypothetical protein
MASDRAGFRKDFPRSDRRNLAAKECPQSVCSKMSHHRLLSGFELCRRQIAASDARGRGILVHLLYHRSDSSYWLLQQFTGGRSWPLSFCTVNAHKAAQTLRIPGQIQLRFWPSDDQVADLSLCKLAVARDGARGVGSIFGQRLLCVVLGRINLV